MKKMFNLSCDIIQNDPLESSRVQTGLEGRRAGGQEGRRAGGVMVEQRVTRFGAHVNVSITGCFLNPNHTTLRSKTPVTSH